MSDVDDKYMSSSQQTLLAVLLHLAERPFGSHSLDSLTRACGCSRDQAFRALKNLERVGFAQTMNAGWALGHDVVRVSERARLHLAELHETYLGDGR